VLRRPRLGAAVQSYMTKVTSDLFRKLGGLGDAPASGTYRGERWAGFATRRVKKYGQSVPEGTRFYWRGRKKSQGNATMARAAKRKGLGSYTGPTKMEKVWRKRASGKKYSPSSKLLQDTGRLRNFTHHIQRLFRGYGRTTSMTLRAGKQVSYFSDQHERRPIWLVHKPTDEPAIAAIIDNEIKMIVREGRRR